MNPTSPTHEEIALAAYFLWETESRPAGRELEHWQRAEERLYRERGAPPPPAATAAARRLGLQVLA